MKYLVSLNQQGAVRDHGIFEYKTNMDGDVCPETADVLGIARHAVNQLMYHALKHARYEWVYGQLPAMPRIAEVGVDFGDGIDKIIHCCTNPTVFGVDPYLRCDFDTWYSCEQSEMDKRYLDVVSRFVNHNVHIERTTSDNFFEEYRGPYFDCVHIDGDHRKEQAWRDLINADKWTKVGGCILIDDVYDSTWTEGLTECARRAVSELGLKKISVDRDPVVLQKVK